MIEKVHVALGDRAYDIVIGTELIQQSSKYITPLLSRSEIFIVTDENVAKEHLPRLTEALQSENLKVHSFVLPSGEATKSWTHFTKTVEWLLDQKVERRDLVIALGGGVIGDLVGFAAAVLRRGVRFVQMPTSLLAQVDSSVGGKTGINTAHGKNLVGAFHQPSLVLADISALDSLTARDFLAGYGEVVKYGLLGNALFFSWLENNGARIMAGDKDARIQAVKTSCEMKAEIVMRDETEQGDRALLNLGHTFCHALEAATGYSDRLLHGEGVAIGCALAFELSARLKLCSQEAPSRVRAHLKDMGMRTDLCDISGKLPDAAGLLDLMKQDKKVVDGRLAFILAKDIGSSFVSKDVDQRIVCKLLEDALAGR